MEVILQVVRSQIQQLGIIIALSEVLLCFCAKGWPMNFQAAVFSRYTLYIC
jgi:hypothetical protein